MSGYLVIHDQRPITTLLTFKNVSCVLTIFIYYNVYIIFRQVSVITVSVAKTFS